LTLQWQEWNSDTINLAKELDKPIFLSSGYSACHWCVSPLIYLPLRLAHLSSADPHARCHVLAHESFEDEAIAKIMNDSFVNVKLDREERPDIDRIYMTYLQVSAE
jgi:uncharacterized protein YyaL (SSP411 family)